MVNLSSLILDILRLGCNDKKRNGLKVYNMYEKQIKVGFTYLMYLHIFTFLLIYFSSKSDKNNRKVIHVQYKQFVSKWSGFNEQN